MPFDPHLAAIRFGTGLSPVIAPPVSVAAMLEALHGPDLMAARYPIAQFVDATPDIMTFRAVADLRRDTRDTPRAEEGEDAHRALQEQQRLAQYHDFTATLARMVRAPDGLRERLVQFWADHFTVIARNGMTRHLVTPFIESAIRPHVAGDFRLMLRAVVTHPMMLAYLDQNSSFGPESDQGLRQGRGLNENLAREVMELYTLGVGGPYTQPDIIEFAQVLTGLHWPMRGMEAVYAPPRAEPGAETVLGVTYAAEADLAVIHAVLDDLARHPATATHLARKMAQHFVADDPDADMVAAMVAAYGADCDLGAMVAAMLNHPAAWTPVRDKARWPLEYVAAALRALDVPEEALRNPDRRDGAGTLLNPLTGMGQSWQAPPDPSGWPKTAAGWITPQFLAARIDWAMRMPTRILPDLPDPRDFARSAYGDPPPEVVFAAEAAEDRRTGIGILLSAAAFHRR